MRTEQEMMDAVLGFARRDERIRVVGMEGSRTNIHAPRDEFQDYDISFLVTDMASFQQSDNWLDAFGPRIILQKPEAMELFAPELGNWFSYLMLFRDGAKMDLTLVPLEELPLYLSSDKLLRILLDKDGRVLCKPEPTDEDYWIKRPTPACVDDCCNEFWFTSTYVAKGLCRDELLFAAYHMEAIVRPQLLLMLSWRIGLEKGFTFSVGKHYKYIRPYLTQPQWELLLRTYRMDGVAHCWQALFAAHSLFRQASKEVARLVGHPYPDYDEQVSGYIAGLYRRFGQTG